MTWTILHYRAEESTSGRREETALVPSLKDFNEPIQDSFYGMVKGPTSMECGYLSVSHFNQTFSSTKQRGKKF